MVKKELGSIVLSVFLSGTCLAFNLWVLFNSTFRCRQSTNKTEDKLRLTDTETESSDETCDVEFLPSSTVLEWTDVTCTYVTKRGHEKCTTLSNAFGRLKTRELTAIMGPSGSGKSTLLDILSGRKTTGLMTGSLQIFETKSVPADKASRMLRNVTAFVPQEVVFFPMQTPEEAVLFVAHLTHGKNGTSLAECHRILRDVGLNDPSLYNRPIGGSLAGGMNVRGLSGGEKKRLALACALSMKPKLLMLDEITSGLDSENALMIIRLVKQVCITRNVAAAIVIHQPDGYIFETFDRLILLSQGKCIFSDDASRLDELYEHEFCSELPVSQHEIPLDLMRKLNTSGEATRSDLILCDVYSEVFADDAPELNDLYEGEPCQRDTDTSSSYDDDVYSEVFTDDVPQLQDLHDFQSIDSTDSKYPTESSLDDESSATSTKRKTTIPSPSESISFSWKLFVVMQRNLTNHYIRNVTNLAARLLCYSACSLLDGAIFWQVGTNKKVNNEEAVVGAFTFITMISYLLPFATIPIFVHEKKFFLSERSLGLYSPWIYCISQAILETWVLVQTAIVEALIVIPMCGLHNSSQPYWESFLTLLSALIASGLTGSVLVLFFSILMPTHDLAFLLCSGVVTISLGLSGGFVPFPSVQDFISWLQWMSPCKYSLQALAIGHFEGTDSESFVAMMGLDRPSTVTANIGALFAFFAFWAIGSMCALYRQRERR